MEINFLSSVKKINRAINIRAKKTQKNILVSKNFDYDYFDGDRKFGYGGYYNDGRWNKVAKKIINHYKLKENSKVLDVGCAKGYLVSALCSFNINAFGIDISEYAIKNSEASIRDKLTKCNAKNLSFKDNYFDAVISFNTIHNLKESDCIKSLQEIMRVSKKSKFVQVDAYENNKEKKDFLNWVLTAETHGTPEYWYKIFKKANYDGDWFWTKV
jgi:ubiquinone/menaquinone biosynthesis C-methylase UbiE